jgi:hypothetical protein
VFTCAPQMFSSEPELSAEQLELKQELTSEFRALVKYTLQDFAVSLPTMGSFPELRKAFKIDESAIIAACLKELLEALNECPA